MASARSEWEQLFQASAIAPLSHTQERAEVIAIAGSDQPKTILVRSHNGDLEVQDLLTANLHHVGDIGKLMLRSAFLTHRLDFSAFITLVTASTPQELPELALAGMPVDIVYASTDGTVGVRRGRLQAVAANASSPMTAIPRAVRDSSSSEDLSTTRVIISGAKDLLSSIGGVDGGACTSSALCQLVDRVAQGKKMEESALWDALHDTWSPSGYRLSSAIFRLFFRDPAVSPALQSFDEALATFDGQYSATALAPTLIEIVRAHLFNFLQTSLAIIDQGQPWSRFAAHNNQYASLLAGQNMTALPRLSVLTHRTEGIASLLERAEFSPGLRDFLGNGTEHGLSWLREHFPNNVFQPSSKQQGNAAAWLWGQIHAKSIPHVLDPMGKFQDAVLALGPMEGAGGLDSAWLASYSGTVIGHHLLGRQDLHSRRNDLHTAVAMMVTMADGEGESITAEGLGLRSQHDARPCPRYAAFQRATWAGVLSVLDAFTGRYHEKRR